MENSKKTLLVKILKVTGITFIISLLIIVLLPIVFADTITEKVKILANKNLEGELNFNESELSFLKHFPSLTLTLHELNLNGSSRFSLTQNTNNAVIFIIDQDIIAINFIPLLIATWVW